MSNMTQIIPTRSHNIGFAFDRRVFARRFSYIFDECGYTLLAGKISRSNPKKGG
jgi:hypothetical protein